MSTRPSEPLGEPGPVTYELAPYSARVWAFLIDLLPMVAVAFAVVIGVWIGEGTIEGERPRELAERWALLVGAPIGLLYAPLLMIRGGDRNGQTLGKQAMRIRVVRENGAAIGLGTAVLREIFGRQLLIAFTSGVYAVVDYAWPLWDGGRQALHDKIAQTRVVLAEPTPRGDFTTGYDAHAPLPASPPEPQPAREPQPAWEPQPAAEDQPATGSAAPPPRDDSPVRDGWLPPRSS